MTFWTLFWECTWDPAWESQNRLVRSVKRDANFVLYLYIYKLKIGTAFRDRIHMPFVGHFTAHDQVFFGFKKSANIIFAAVVCRKNSLRQSEVRRFWREKYNLIDVCGDSQKPLLKRTKIIHRLWFHIIFLPMFRFDSNIIWSSMALVPSWRSTWDRNAKLP